MLQSIEPYAANIILSLTEQLLLFIITLLFIEFLALIERVEPHNLIRIAEAA